MQRSHGLRPLLSAHLSSDYNFHLYRHLDTTAHDMLSELPPELLDRIADDLHHPD